MNWLNYYNVNQPEIFMEDPSKITEKQQLNSWTMAIESDFNKTIKFLNDAKEILSENGKLHKKLKYTEYSLILKEIEETNREICIVLRRIELFYSQYKSSSDSYEAFTSLKRYSTSTSDTISVFRDKWNETMSKIDTAIRVVKG